MGCPPVSGMSARLHRSRIRFTAPIPYVLKAEVSILNRNHRCNHQERVHETRRYRVAPKISDLHLGGTPRNRRFWVEVLAGAISWGFKSPSPHHILKELARSVALSRDVHGRDCSGLLGQVDAHWVSRS
jgi:hypothetical protein